MSPDSSTTSRPRSLEPTILSSNPHSIYLVLGIERSDTNCHKPFFLTQKQIITIIIIIPKVAAIIAQYLNIENDCDIVSC